MIPNYQHVVEQCKTQYPQDWKDAHTGNANTEGFIRKLVPILRAHDVRFGLNGKRGNVYDISDDAVNMLCDSADSAGRTPEGLPCVVIDVIGGAGGPSPVPQWGVYNTLIEGSGANVVSGGAPVPIPVPPPIVPGREEALDELKWLDAYYAAPEGLQRPNGLSLNGKPDFEGVAAWYLDVYQQARIKGKSRADARAAYVKDIRHSAEWQAKHPGETP